MFSTNNCIKCFRSTNIVPTFLPLSRVCFDFSIIFSKGFCVLLFLRNPDKSGQYLNLKKDSFIRRQFPQISWIHGKEH